MSVINTLLQTDQNSPQYNFYCPGCRCNHWFKTTGTRPVWTWNEDFNKPTIQPSLLVNYGNGTVCHSWIKDGNIEFLNDSWHEIKGQTVPMIEE